MDHCSFFGREAKFCSRSATAAAHKFAALIFSQRDAFGMVRPETSG
ncbi:MAG TPA: hypothetical protein VKM37_08390 [Balneolaceae bacterium]|nr:hypothetical protein [Balneolaceae bacterium]